MQPTSSNLQGERSPERIAPFFSPGGDGARSYDETISYALVHDWLPVYAGAERVLEQMINVLPDAQLYSLIESLPDEDRAFLQGKEVNTSFIQRLPFSGSKYRYYLPLAPLAIEQFDLTEHDVVVSSSYAVAKGVLTRPDQLHVSYVHSPMRYAWDLHAEYMEQSKMGRGIRGFFARLILHYMRLFDVTSANRVDAFIANSQHVARRIWKTYRRKADVIYPPVDVESFSLREEKEDYYLTVSRLVPYKRVDLIVEAFSQMPGKELLVVGDGPEFDRIKKAAGPNVTMLGYQPDEAVQHYLQRARGFVFAAEEDFGIVPVEAQACGTPVIAYGKGGVLETVVPGQTGLFFRKQTAASLCEAIAEFEKSLEPRFEPKRIRQHAERFSRERFRKEFSKKLRELYRSFVEGSYMEVNGNE